MIFSQFWTLFWNIIYINIPINFEGLAIEWIASKDEYIFYRGIDLLPEKWEKLQLAMENILNKI